MIGRKPPPRRSAWEDRVPAHHPDDDLEWVPLEQFIPFGGSSWPREPRWPPKYEPLHFQTSQHPACSDDAGGHFHGPVGGMVEGDKDYALTRCPAGWIRCIRLFDARPHLGPPEQIERFAREGRLGQVAESIMPVGSPLRPRQT